MKKVFFALLTAAAGTLVACDNTANTATNAKDSLDSIANAKKEMIDSTAEQRKEKIDSTTETMKNAMDKRDSVSLSQESSDTTKKKADR